MRTRIISLLTLLVAIALTNVAAAENIASGVRVVVIDAGHGGRLPGAHYAGVYEKDLVLKVALRLGKLIEQGMPGTKVVYTRTTDKMLGETLAADLQKRADIANAADGELFISIHANAAEARSAKGIEVLVMGETPKEQQYNTNALYRSNREELIDLATEPNAPIVRARIQNMQFTYGAYSMAAARCMERAFRDAGRVVRRIKPQLLRVLYATDMPGVLVEIGFMSNAEEMAFMKSERGLNATAQSMYEAVKEYSAQLQRIREGDEPSVAVADEKVEDAPAETAENPLRWGVQVLSSVQPVDVGSSRFKGYSGKVVERRGVDGLYKYCVGECESRVEAQRLAKEVKRCFADAFVVMFRGETIVKR